MALAKATHRITGEVHYDSTPDSLDPDIYEILPIVGGREPEDFEEVSDTGRIRINMDRLKEKIWGRVKAHRDELERSVALLPQGPVQMDERSKGNIDRIATRARDCKAADRPFVETFTLADNRELSLNADDAIDLSMDVGERISAIYAHARFLRHQIFAASITAKALHALDVKAGWPQ